VICPQITWMGAEVGGEGTGGVRKDRLTITAIPTLFEVGMVDDCNRVSVPGGFEMGLSQVSFGNPYQAPHDQRKNFTA